MKRVRTIVRHFDSDSYFSHRFESVPDQVNKDLPRLLKDERCSEQRFLSDFKKSQSLEALLFLHHDFYRIDRLNGDY